MLISIRGESCRLIDASVCRFTALASISLCCGGVDLDVDGRGHLSRKFDSDILAPSNAVARGAEVLAGEMSAAYICRQFQASGV